MPAEVACLDITPSGDESSAHMCAVGLWDLSARIIKLEDLSFMFSETLGGGQYIELCKSPLQHESNTPIIIWSELLYCAIIY